MKHRPQLESLESRDLLAAAVSPLRVPVPAQDGNVGVAQAAKPVVSLAPVSGDLLTARALSASVRFQGLGKNHNETLVRDSRHSRKVKRSKYRV